MSAPRAGWRYWRNLLLAAVGASAVGFASVLLGLGHRQAAAFLHPARRMARGEVLQERRIPYQEVTLTTADGVRLYAWYTPPQNGAVILVAHGHGETIPEEFYALFAEHGYGVLAWDFRAHGRSGGEFTSIGYYEVLDVQAAVAYALAQPGTEHVGAWGASMGAATLIRAAAREARIEAVIADSAFAALEDAFRTHTPLPILRPFIRFFAERESRAHIRDVRPVDDIGRIGPRPVLIIQGLADAAVPPDSARRLYEAASEPRFLWTEAGVPHTGMYARFRERYTERVTRFFDTYLLKCNCSPFAH